MRCLEHRSGSRTRPVDEVPIPKRERRRRRSLSRGSPGGSPGTPPTLASSVPRGSCAARASAGRRPDSTAALTNAAAASTRSRRAPGDTRHAAVDREPGEERADAAKTRTREGEEPRRRSSGTNRVCDSRRRFLASLEARASRASSSISSRTREPDASVRRIRRRRRHRRLPVLSRRRSGRARDRRPARCGAAQTLRS